MPVMESFLFCCALCETYKKGYGTTRESFSSFSGILAEIFVIFFLKNIFAILLEILLGFFRGSL